LDRRRRRIEPSADDLDRGALASNPRWSPDGTRIVFDSGKAGSKDLYLLDPATTDLQRLTSTPDEEGEPRWSRDGKWVYFYGPDPQRKAYVATWKTPIAGGPAVQVTFNGGGTAEESPDGRWLFYTVAEQARMTLWRMPAAGGAAALMADDLVNSQSFAVGRGVVYAVVRGLSPATLPRTTPPAANHPPSIVAIDIATGVRKTLATFDRPPWWGLALSPDERTLLISLVNTQGIDLMVVEPRQH
jgi:dipeptidyl aminopeptidase/acylaminoacyl peptidase